MHLATAARLWAFAVRMRDINCAFFFPILFIIRQSQPLRLRHFVFLQGGLTRDTKVVKHCVSNVAACWHPRDGICFHCLGGMPLLCEQMLGGHTLYHSLSLSLSLSLSVSAVPQLCHQSFALSAVHSGTRQWPAAI